MGLGFEVAWRAVRDRSAHLPADLDGILQIQGLLDDSSAVFLVEGGAPQVGLGEGCPRRLNPIDQRLGLLREVPARKGLGRREFGWRLDRWGLRVPGSVLSEGLAEALGELRSAQIPVDVGERSAADAIGDDDTGAPLGALQAKAP